MKTTQMAAEGKAKEKDAAKAVKASAKAKATTGPAKPGCPSPADIKKAAGAE